MNLRAIALTLYKTTKLSQLEACADDKINVTEKLKICVGKGRKTLWEKEKMLVTSIFCFFHNVFCVIPQCFQKISFIWSLKVGIM